MQPPSPKKMALLLIGKDLILSKGFAATPIDEICEAAEVTKGAFFHYFKNKVDYGSQLLDHIWEPMRQMQESALEKETVPLQHLHNNIDFVKTFVQDDARLIGILMQELGETQPNIRHKGQGFFQEWGDYVLKLVSEAKSLYAPAADFEPRHIMQFIISTIEGIPTIARQFGPESVEPTITHLKNYLDILFQIKR